MFGVKLIFFVLFMGSKVFRCRVVLVEGLVRCFNVRVVSDFG